MDKFRKKTSMQDIADHLGVSKNAVSLALNNKPGISEGLRQRVVQAAIDLNYGGYGLLHRSADSNSVAICVPNAISSGSQFYSAIYWSIEQELRDHGYRSLLVSVSPEMESRLAFPEAIADSGMIGIILVGSFSRSYVENITHQHEHVVVVDNSFLDLPLTSVVTANLGGGYEAARYLLANGHKRIGFVGPIQRFLAYKERWLGYKLALADAGVDIIPEISFLDSVDSWAVDAADRLKEAVEGIVTREPDALFCACDRIAILLMGILSSFGLRIPEDISVIGFDDVESSDIVSPPLTTMRVHRVEMGRRAVSILLQQLSGAADMPSSVSIYPTLIVRDSVKFMD